MGLIALVGSLGLLLGDATLRRILLPLVALSAGSLIGGAFFHLIPEGIAALGDPARVGLLVVAGFAVFFALELLLHWHHCHRAGADCRKPLTWLILIGDGLHNLLGGIAVGGAFLIDIRLGIVTWVAAAMHEIPQELGDFAVLLHGGWSRRGALAMNFLSALTFLVGGIIAWAAAQTIDVGWLIPFAAGNFLYIGASDLIPEIRSHPALRTNLVNFAAFLTGLGLLYGVKLVFGG